MLKQCSGLSSPAYRRHLNFIALCAVLLGLPVISMAQSIDVTVVTDTPTGDLLGTAGPGGYRWTLEEDTTPEVGPFVPDEDSGALQFHTSYMPVVAVGHETSGASTTLSIPTALLDTSKRYYLSVLPDDGHTLSGKQVHFDGGSTASVNVVVNSLPIPTAQISVFAYEDNEAINNNFDVNEKGLGGFTVFISDNAGAVLTDTYGNALGTVYEDVVTDPEGTPTVKTLGDGTIRTMTQAEVDDPALNPYALEVGEALIKNIAPGKYGVQVVPDVW